MCFRLQQKRIRPWFAGMRACRMTRVRDCAAHLRENTGKHKEWGQNCLFGEKNLKKSFFYSIAKMKLSDLLKKRESDNFFTKNQRRRERFDALRPQNTKMLAKNQSKMIFFGEISKKRSLSLPCSIFQRRDQTEPFRKT